MKQSARPTVPRARRRGVTVGALLAAVALAPGLLLAPAAVAAPVDVERDSGSGEPAGASVLRAPVFESGMWTSAFVDLSAPFTADAVALRLSAPGAPQPPATGTATMALQVDGPAPADLDLAGVRFELTGPGAEPTTTPCVTDPAGRCAIRVVPAEPADDVEIGEVPSSDELVGGAEVVLPAGTYAVRQVAAPAGLVPAEEIAPLELCVAPAPAGCVTSRTVVNVSAYRTRTEIQVLSANGLVAGTAVSLTGPDFPATTVVTDEDGRGAWSGWFRPGEWSFLVAGQPAPLLMIMTADQGDTSRPWRLELTLPSAARPEVAAPVPPAGPSAGAPPSGFGQPAPGAGPRADAGAAAVAGVRPAGRPQPIALLAPTPVPIPIPIPITVPAPAGTGAGQASVAAAVPVLETEGSAQLLSAGLVTGIGIVFVALVLSGYGVLRNRQRRRA